jgi:hypothetical protein
MNRCQIKHCRPRAHSRQFHPHDAIGHLNHYFAFGEIEQPSFRSRKVLYFRTGLPDARSKLSGIRNRATPCAKPANSSKWMDVSVLALHLLDDSKMDLIW